MVRSRPRVAAVAVVAAVVFAVVLAACGNGGESGSPTPGQQTREPLPEPTITGNAFVFPGRGYSVTIPDGWTADPNSVAAGSLVVDAFLSPEQVEGVQTNIAVTCEENEAGIDLPSYLEAKLDTARQLDARDLKRVGALEVSGVPAEMVEYSFVREDVTVKKVDVMFVGGPCAWTISLTVAPSAIEGGRTTLNAFLASFELLASEAGSSPAG